MIIDQNIALTHLQRNQTLTKETMPTYTATTGTLTAKRIRLMLLRRRRHIRVNSIKVGSVPTQRCRRVRTQADKKKQKNVLEKTSTARREPTNRQRKAAWRTTLEGLLRTNTKVTLLMTTVGNRLMQTRLAL